MTTRHFIILAFFLFLTPYLPAQNYWFGHSVDHYSGQISHSPTLEDMSVIVEPQGAYMKVDVTLELSTEWNLFPNNSDLEISFRFGLPKDAVVIDSWLWIGEDIIRAKLIDFWSAVETYNEIVGARTIDPSLLTKSRSGNNIYQLNIYPLNLQNKSRKFRVSYLVPARWTKDEVKADLPFPVLNESFNSSTPLRLKVKSNSEWGRPWISERPTINFIDEGDYEYTLTYRPFNYRPTNTMTITFDAPYKDGIYLSTTTFKDENYYQLGVLPFEVFNSNSVPKKTLILLDYEFGNTTMRLPELISGVEELVKKHYSEQDSFKLVLSGLNHAPVASSWMSGNDDDITSVFEALETEDISVYSSLFSLIAYGIQYAEMETDEIEILLISCSDGVENKASADALLDDLLAISATPPRIHILDYQNYNLVNYIRFQNINYRGNTYFYHKLATATDGSLDAASFPIFRSINELFQDAAFVSSTPLTSFNLGMTVSDNGRSYEGIKLYDPSTATIDRPVFQIGKYIGDFPLTLHVEGNVRGNEYIKSIQIDNPNNESTQIPQIWAGKRIEVLEKQSNAEETHIQEAIGLSYDYRVLSIYTAFLALEPSLGGEICHTCEEEEEEEDDVVATNDLEQKIQINTAPNPFRDQVIIQISFGKKLELEHIQFSISDIYGRRIKDFQIEDWKLSGDVYELIWDGTDDAGNQIESGLYFFTILTEKVRKTIKVLKI